MASPQANRLTQRHRDRLSVVVEMVVRQVRAIAGRADAADIDGWWRRQEPALVRLVTRGFLTAAQLAARYLAAHAAAETARVAPVQARLDRPQLNVSLLVTGPVAFKRHIAKTGSDTAALRTMQQTLAGAAGRLTLLGDRQTLLDTLRDSDEMVGYRRVAAVDPCAFCLMLVSRGAVYSKDTADFRAHDHCRCSAVPLYAREPEPASVTALRAQWDQVTAGVRGAEKLTAWRHFIDQQRPAATAD